MTGAFCGEVSRLRILKVSPRYFPHFGGIEEHVRNVSENMVAKGFDVTIATTDSSGRLPKEEIVNGVPVKRFDAWTPSDSYYFSGGLKRYLLENSDDCDIVHAHSYHAFPAVYAAQSKRGNKLVFSPHYHGGGHTFFRNLLHIPYKWFWGKAIFDKADRVVCVSNYEKDLVLKRFDVCERKVVKIPNGIDTRLFSRLCEKKDRMKSSSRNILYVGRLEEYKGVHWLIDALPKLGDDIFLEIVGKGPCKGNLVKRATRQGVINRIRFLESLPKQDILQRYVDASLFVTLSSFEAYGITVAEALASGTPCIVADRSALSEWIDGESCFGIRMPVDVDEFVNLVNKVIGKTINIPKIPSWQQVAKEMVEVYNSCLNEREVC